MDKNNLICTQSMAIFNELQVPMCDSIESISCDIEFPRALEFKRTYYMYKNNRLIAFRIVAYALFSRLTTYRKTGLSFLVQTPNEPIQWIEEFIKPNTKVFADVESFMEHQVTGKGNISLDWTMSPNMFPFLKDWHNISLKGKVWCWNDETKCPRNDFSPLFTSFLVYENNLFVLFPKQGFLSRDYYLSKEDCVKSRLDGMEIIDFDDSDTIFECEIQITSTRKKIHTLRFLDE